LMRSVDQRAEAGTFGRTPIVVAIRTTERPGA
jgi:hypothetical protein